MELNLLFLPLLGGYLFFTRFHGTAYAAARCDGQRIIFNSAAYGVLFLGMAQAIAVSTAWLAETTTEIAQYAALAAISTALTVNSALVTFGLTARKSPRYMESLGAAKPILGAALGILVLIQAFRLAPATPFSLYAVIGSMIALAAVLFVVANMLARIVEEIRFDAYYLRGSIFVAVVAQIFLIWASMPDKIEDVWHRYSPYENSATAVMALVLAFAIMKALNLLWPYQTASRRSHESGKSNTLEKLLYDSATEGTFVQLTLADSKVYIGFIDWLAPNPSISEGYFKILPVMSGYRDANRQMRVTTYYSQIIEKHVSVDKDGTTNESRLQDFVKVIPYGQVIAAGRFNEKVFLDFVAASKPTKRAKRKSSKRRSTTKAEGSSAGPE